MGGKENHKKKGYDLFLMGAPGAELPLKRRIFILSPPPQIELRVFFFLVFFLV